MLRTISDLLNLQPGAAICDGARTIIRSNRATAGWFIFDEGAYIEGGDAEQALQFYERPQRLARVPDSSAPVENTSDTLEIRCANLKARNNALLTENERLRKLIERLSQ